MRKTRLTRELVAGDELVITTPSGESFTIVCEQRDQEKCPSRARFSVCAERETKIVQVYGKDAR